MKRRKRKNWVENRRKWRVVLVRKILAKNNEGSGHLFCHNGTVAKHGWFHTYGSHGYQESRKLWIRPKKLGLTTISTPFLESNGQNIARAYINWCACRDFMDIWPFWRNLWSFELEPLETEVSSLVIFLSGAYLLRIWLKSLKIQLNTCSQRHKQTKSVCWSFIILR